MYEIFIFYLFIFIIGLIMGSFLNVIIDRLPFGRSIIFPFSHCPHCKHRLSFTDLVPVASYFYLGRKCRYCKASISFYYPFIEIITGLLFVLATYQVVGLSIITFLIQIGQTRNIVYLLIVISILIIVFFIDLKYGIIPFKILLFLFIIITLNYILLYGTDYLLLWGNLGVAIITFLIFFLLFAVTRGKAIGFGDVVYSFIMGYMLGFPNIVLAVYIAFLTGAIISLILVISHRKKLKGDTIPFGPFLTFATIVSLFWGQAIISEILVYFHVY